MKKICFISGHLDLTKDEFDTRYKPQIDDALKLASVEFVIGDAKGSDTLAQEYLLSKCLDDESLFKRITIYHMRDKPRNYLSDRFNKICGFVNDEARDVAMTSASTDDIAWIRPLTQEFIESLKQKLGSKYKPNRISGTEKNLLRRRSL